MKAYQTHSSATFGARHESMKEKAFCTWDLGSPHTYLLANLYAY